MADHISPLAKPALAGVALVLALAYLSWPFAAQEWARAPGFLLVYLFLGWALLIAFLALVARALRRLSGPRPPSAGRGR